MKNNTISATAYLVNDGVLDLLKDSSPKDAIEDYLCPDMRPPVQTLVIKAQTDDGKTVTLSISPTRISAIVE